MKNSEITRSTETARTRLKAWIQSYALTLAALASAMLALSSVALGSPLITVDGGMTTGGGGAVVCRDAQNRVTHAELYDIFEGRERFGISVEKSPRPAQDQLMELVSKLESNNVLKWGLINAVQAATQKVIFTPRNFKMKAPGDLGDGWGMILPVGCEIEGAAYYERDGKLRIMEGVWEALSETDKLGLILHEAVYLVRREGQYGETDSESTRKSVATTLSQISTPIDSVAEALFRGFKQSAINQDPSWVQFIDAEHPVSFTAVYESVDGTPLMDTQTYTYMSRYKGYDYGTGGTGPGIVAHCFTINGVKKCPSKIVDEMSVDAARVRSELGIPKSELPKKIRVTGKVNGVVFRQYEYEFNNNYSNTSTPNIGMRFSVKNSVPYKIPAPAGAK